MNTQIEIAEGVLEKLVEANPTIDPARFKIAYDVVVRSVDELHRMIPATVGKQVWVIPTASAFVERADRGADRNNYACGVLAVDRVDPPNEHLLNPDHADQLTLWANERIEWVKNYVRVPLAAAAFAPVTGAFLTEWLVTELLDPELLMEHGIFWSSLLFTYAIDESNT